MGRGWEGGKGVEMGKMKKKKIIKRERDKKKRGGEEWGYWSCRKLWRWFRFHVLRSL